MELYVAGRDVPLRGTGNLVAIGKWDGVHLAHQSIIRALVAAARRTGGQSVVMGFHPLPMQVLRPNSAPPVLQTLRERAETLSAMGVDVHLAVGFDAAFAQLTPEAFVREVLVDALQAQEVMVGFNFTFARGGAGTATTLRALCDECGIPVQVFSPVRIDGESVSSTEVRLYVAAGDMERAAKLLGRPFALSGEVVRGDGRGHTIGFPTANLNLLSGRQLPATGVYVARATVLEQPGPDLEMLPCTITPRSGRTFNAVLNLGWRPTFQGADLRCEVHLLDFDGDIYGRELRVEFLHRLRGEKQFPSVEALKAQLASDVAAARAYL